MSLYSSGTPYKTQEVSSPLNHDEPEKEYRGKGSTPSYQPHKDIFAYYPPQSAYDGPKQPVRNYKPVYFEDTPRKHPENAYQQHILPLLENVGKRPVYRQILLNQDVDTGEKTFIRITPLGNVDANDLEHLGQIDLSDIQLVDPNALRKYPKYNVPDYSVLKDPMGIYPTVKDYPGKRPYSFVPYGARQNAAPLHYDVGGALPYQVVGASAYKTPANIYESGFSLAAHRPIARPLNPIETKKLRNILLQADQQIADLSPPKAPSLYGVGKKPLSPAAKSFASQMRAYLGSRRPTYKDKAQSAIAPYRPMPQNLVYLPLKTTSPKFSTLDGSYLDTTLKASSPNVGLQALKTSPQGGRYADIGSQALKGLGYGHQTPDKEYLYLTASTPESTQVSDAAERDYIFVSSSGSRAEGGGEKQFFHAYYAPADHSPPPGYVRMAVQEFKDLFRNADIRYVDGKEPAP